MKSVPAESFFNCFESREAPKGDKDQDDDDEDEETAKLLDAIDESMQVALDFNDLYMWEALEYYLNFGQNPGDFMDMHGQDHSDGDDDDEDNEPKSKAPKKKEQKKNGGAEGGEEQKQECKQQ